VLVVVGVLVVVSRKGPEGEWQRRRVVVGSRGGRGGAEVAEMVMEVEWVLDFLGLIIRIIGLKKD